MKLLIILSLSVFAPTSEHPNSKSASVCSSKSASPRSPLHQSTQPVIPVNENRSDRAFRLLSNLEDTLPEETTIAIIDFDTGRNALLNIRTQSTNSGSDSRGYLKVIVNPKLNSLSDRPALRGHSYIYPGSESFEHRCIIEIYAQNPNLPFPGHMNRYTPSGIPLSEIPVTTFSGKYGTISTLSFLIHSDNEDQYYDWNDDYSDNESDTAASNAADSLPITGNDELFLFQGHIHNIGACSVRQCLPEVAEWLRVNKIPVRQTAVVTSIA